MSTNNLTPEQDLLAREFFQKVSNQPHLFPSDPVGQRNMNTALLRLLNYEYVGGAFITPGKVVTYKLGTPVNVECEWESDTERSLNSIALGAKLDEANRGQSENKADSSKSATDTEVRETVLREDV